MDETFNTGEDFDECTVIGHNNNLTLYFVTNFEVSGESIPGMGLKLFETESDTLLLLIVVDNNHFEFLVERYNLFRVIYAAPRKVSDVDETIDTTEVDEYTIRCDVLDSTCQYRTLLEACHDLFLLSFDFGLNYLGYDSSSSMLCAVAAFIAPVFGPLGFGDWRISTALVTGFLAKESVVSTLEVLMPQGLGSILTPGSVIPLLVFCLLYTPCVAAVASIRREMGGKWAFGVVIGQCALAWIAALAARGLCLLAGVV